VIVTSCNVIAEDAGDLAVLIPRTAMDFIGHEHRLAVLQPPCRPRVRQSAVSFPSARRNDLLGPHCLGDIFRGRCSPAARSFSRSPLLSAGLLPLLYRAHREGLRIVLARHTVRLPVQGYNQARSAGRR
jgi:hypothetical protein